MQPHLRKKVQRKYRIFSNHSCFPNTKREVAFFLYRYLNYSSLEHIEREKPVTINQSEIPLARLKSCILRGSSNCQIWNKKNTKTCLYLMYFLPLLFFTFLFFSNGSGSSAPRTHLPKRGGRGRKRNFSKRWNVRIRALSVFFFPVIWYVFIRFNLQGGATNAVGQKFLRPNRVWGNTGGVEPIFIRNGEYLGNTDLAASAEPFISHSFAKWTMFFLFFTCLWAESCPLELAFAIFIRNGEYLYKTDLAAFTKWAVFFLNFFTCLWAESYPPELAFAFSVLKGEKKIREGGGEGVGWSRKFTHFFFNENFFLGAAKDTIHRPDHESQKDWK